MQKSPSSTDLVLESWSKPLLLVLTLHIGLALAVTFTPQFSKKKPRFENIYTVDLIEIPSSPPPAQAPTPAPKEEVAQKPISINKATPEPAVTPVAEVQPISIKPLKKKIKKKIVAKPTPPKEDKSKLVEERKRLAELIRQENLAKEAELEALRALDEAREMVSNSEPATPNNSFRNSSRASQSGGSNNLSGVEAQWFSAVKSHVLDYWRLPELKLWNPELVAVVIIKVDSNGKIVESYFEDPSGDRVFDQFVSKSLQDANPLPAMPAAMRKKSFEFGLNFRPDTIN